MALAFRVGLFNIGGEGQFLVGAALAAIVGFSFAGLPWFIHMPLAVLAGFVGGAIWGFIPGILKARTGAHEVIVTIMTNYIAYNLIGWALEDAVHPARGPQRPDLEDRGGQRLPRPAGQRAARPLGHRRSPSWPPSW